MNAMEWNRDLTWPIEEIREREQGLTDKPDRGQEQGWAMTQAQLAWYCAMEERGELVQIRDLATLNVHVDGFDASRHPSFENLRTALTTAEGPPASTLPIPIGTALLRTRPTETDATGCPWPAWTVVARRD